MNAWDEDDQARPPALSLSSLPRVCGSVCQARVWAIFAAALARAWPSA